MLGTDIKFNGAVTIEEVAALLVHGCDERTLKS